MYYVSLTIVLTRKYDMLSDAFEEKRACKLLVETNRLTIIISYMLGDDDNLLNCELSAELYLDFLI